MNTREYLASLKKLGLLPNAQRTADALGMSVRGIQKIASGDVRVPGPVGRLLPMYLKYRLPKEYRA